MKEIKVKKIKKLNLKESAVIGFKKMEDKINELIDVVNSLTPKVKD